MYMAWYDDGKRPAADKIAAGVAAYLRHFSARPTVVLVNEADKDVTVTGIEVRVAGHVRVNNYWFGEEGV